MRIDRRSFLGGLAFTAACSSRRTQVRTPVTPSAGRQFARVDVSPDRVIRTVVGLRPYRPSGFVVRRESIEEKTIIHNYGHGGGGVTLSWGTGHLAVEQALPTGAMRMAVLGSGAVGLATARLLPGTWHRSHNLHQGASARHDVQHCRCASHAGHCIRECSHDTGVHGAVHRGSAVLVSPLPAHGWRLLRHPLAAELHLEPGAYCGMVL